MWHSTKRGALQFCPFCRPIWPPAGLFRAHYGTTFCRFAHFVVPAAREPVSMKLLVCASLVFLKSGILHAHTVYVRALIFNQVSILYAHTVYVRSLIFSQVSILYAHTVYVRSFSFLHNGIQCGHTIYVHRHIISQYGIQDAHTQN